MVKAKAKKKPKKTKEFSTEIKGIGAFNTISVTVILVVTAMVFLISIVLLSYSQESIKGLQNDLSADFISNLQVFNKDIYSGNVEELQNDLNQVMSGSIYNTSGKFQI